MRLLRRTTRSVAPTGAGAALLARLEPVFGEVAAAVDTAKDLRDGRCGTLWLNVPNAVARLTLPDLVARFLAAYPGCAPRRVADRRAQPDSLKLAEAGRDQEG